ncbi:uncharacterized protein MELLADRAFT_33238 [Melampsora larici-populina 98AG31]|uniref:Major facilitator superfamily (MFS) profile domain-containing protein n=1 Tax=Melampsora larici-populina (strain 98AG31 / pathotype 3-4-7) TaxID=747676 RepID=F4R8I1_MELLP|nr:uncharacterized protein MELLADRAFT_33238 [Melampsora larici-populina 98AG31]EGG11597.1 hypothetical protein MELLADRAFT_33238 [Melampsora larici-populina 98AG31]
MTKVNTETSPKDEKLWCDLDEEQIIPENSLPIVFLGLMLALFLAAMDQTIVAIALPRIIAQLHGFSGYSWVGTAYLLVTATLSPLYGRLSDAVGRKPVLVGSIVMFLVGSALCGAAQNLPWLILCRGLQGVGGGGIFPLVQIVMADITTLEERGKWAGATGTTWSIAAVLGPVLGGILTDRLSWRWTFYINLPLGALSCTIITLFLNTNPPPKKSFKSHLSSFDFLGLSCIFCSVSLLLLGFSFSESSWRSPATISCLCLGIASLGLTVFVELTTKRLPIIPPRLFMDRTPALLLLCSFLHAVVYYASAYYLPLYFQSLGASATLAGIKGLAYSLTTGLFTTLGGLILPSLSDYRYILWFCWGVQIIGYGLMTQLSETSSITKQEIYPFIAAMGTGGLFVPPLIALQGAMPVADLASSTSTYVLNRILGATLGVSIGHTIFASRLVRFMASLRRLESDVSSSILVKLDID